MTKNGVRHTIKVQMVVESLYIPPQKGNGVGDTIKYGGGITIYILKGTPKNGFGVNNTISKMVLETP